MEFIIKTYTVPVKRHEDNTVSYEEVKLGPHNLIEEKEIEIKFSADIPPEANKITNWNNIQLAVARADKKVTDVEKKVLCSNTKPVNN